jgi:hypothetical protein
MSKEEVRLFVQAHHAAGIKTGAPLSDRTPSREIRYIISQGRHQIQRLRFDTKRVSYRRTRAGNILPMKAHVAIVLLALCVGACSTDGGSPPDDDATSWNATTAIAHAREICPIEPKAGEQWRAHRYGHRWWAWIGDREQEPRCGFVGAWIGSRATADSCVYSGCAVGSHQYAP